MPTGEFQSHHTKKLKDAAPFNGIHEKHHAYEEKYGVVIDVFDVSSERIVENLGEHENGGAKYCNHCPIHSFSYKKSIHDKKYKKRYEFIHPGSYPLFHDRTPRLYHETFEATKERNG